MEQSGKTSGSFDKKNILIVVLALAVIVQGIFLFRGGLSPEEAEGPVEPEANQTIEVEQTERVEQVRVAAVTLEQEYKRYLLIAFDRPVGEEHVGQVLDDPPAAIDPDVVGSWTWISPFVLRFDPVEPFGAREQYDIRLDTGALVGDNQEFEGDSTLTVRTGSFEIKNFSIQENPVQDGTAMVVLSGNIEFSYTVDPKDLAARIKMIDPLAGEDSPLEVYITDGYRSRWISYRSEPIEKKAERRDVRIVVDKSLTPAWTTITLDRDYERVFPVVFNNKLMIESTNVESNEDQSSLSISFSTPVDQDTAKKYLSVEPSVAYNISSSGKYLYLSGGFKPGTEYTLTVKQGLSAADGAVLMDEYTEVLMVPDLVPTVAFEDKGMFLSKSGFQNLAVKTVNVDKFEVSVDRVYNNNLFTMLFNISSYAMFSDTYYLDNLYHSLGDRIYEGEIEVKGGLNEVKRHLLNMDELVGEAEPGIYRVFANLPGEWEGSQRWLLVTDMGIVAKQGEDDFLAWVSSFDDLSPKAGATVTLISDQNQVIAQGTTDSDGLWRVQDLGEKYKDHRPYIVTAQSGDDFSFMLLENFSVDTTGLDVGGAEVKKEGYTAFLYGERDIYRPGETAPGVAIVRDAYLNVPPSMPLIFRQKDPQGKELATTVAQSDDRGLAEFSLDIPEYALTGSYTLELLVGEDVIGTYRYKVEEFMPDRIKVEIETKEPDVAAGETVDFKVLSRYFFGPPASGLQVETRVRLEAAPFAPEGFEQYSFGNPEVEFEDQEIFFNEDVLDENGDHLYKVEIPDSVTPPAALNAVLTSRVMERGGRGVSAMQMVRAHAYPRYPGLKRKASYRVEKGSEVSFDYVVVSPQGKETPASALKVEFYKDRWQTVLRRTPSGGFRYESERDSWLERSLEIPAGEGNGSFTFTPPDYGSYRVVLTDVETGAACQAEFYASYYDYYNPWAIKNPGKIEIVPDKEEYMPGDTARFEIRAPFAGKLLLSVEGQSVQDVFVHELTGNTAEVEVPVKAEYSPNVYATAILVRSAKDLEPGGVARASGSVPFYVNRSANKPDIVLHAPQEVRPETELTIAIQTEANATVTLAAVDEGILQLIAQETPDPFPFFYAKRALGVVSYDIFSWLFPEIADLMDKSPAGGDGLLDKRRQFVRTEGIRRVKPVAYWSGPITADEEGKAEYTIQLPEFQGALRLMCVAVNGKRFSSTHALTRVRSPLIVTPTFPRFMSMDETVLIPVTVRNDTPQDGEFIVSVETRGPATVPEDTQTVFVAKGTEELLYFALKTGDAEGKLVCVTRAEGNNEVAKSEVELGIRAAYPARTLMDTGSFDTAESELPLPDVSGFRPDTVTREIRIGRIPLVQFSGNLKYLLRYPYGCIEQTTSRVFPLLYFSELAEELDPDLFNENTANAYVQRGIQRIMAMQTHEGGFAYWPGGSAPSTWGTIYATHFLLEAKRKGFHVSQAVLDRATDYITAQVKGQESYSNWELNRTTYALYVLALAGKADKGSMDFLHRQFVTKLRSGPGVYLGAAYALLGDRQALEDLISGNWQDEKIARQTGGNFGSTLRNLAMRLSVLVDVAPEDDRIPIVIKDLMERMRVGYYYTTQENAFALMALGKFFAKQQAKGPYSGELYLGDTLLGEFSSDKVFYYQEIEGVEPLRVVMNTGYEPGAAFFSVQTRGVPTKQAYEPVNNGILVERKYLTRMGDPLQLNAVKQGDLVVLETRVKSLSGKIENVVVQNLLPTGLEVENPRLETTEKLPWIEKVYTPEYQDLRDDRVLLFVNVHGNANKPSKNKWVTFYSLLRAVSPGEFNLPPVQAEAMYDPEIICSGPADMMRVEPDTPVAAPENRKEDEPVDTDTPDQEGDKKNLWVSELAH